MRHIPAFANSSEKIDVPQILSCAARLCCRVENGKVVNERVSDLNFGVSERAYGA